MPDVQEKAFQANEFPVVGIGASAGGLEAVKLFISHVPEKSGMAYVFVQHLNPDVQSSLPQILQRSSKIPVLEISDDIYLQQDHFYIIPSNKMLTAVDGKLKLEARSEKNKKIKVIDLFFTSLGVVHQAFAVGVVLSGTLDDGTLGIKVIKANGGMTFAQDDTAAFEDMPKNAINSGAADFVLPPDKIIEKLITINLSFNTGAQSNLPRVHNAQEDDAVYRQILGLLRLKYDVDFTYYKQTTIKRRVLRRVGLTGQSTITEYLQLVKEKKKELDTLFKDMFISVTDFFRDGKTYDTFCNTILPQIINEKQYNEPIRVWVAGCASGEEAYSIAICIHEVLGVLATEKKVQIFATDISDAMIVKARTGIYKADATKKISPGRLSKFFTKVDGSYQVNKEIRQTCIFAKHNLLKDPPFSRMDLISCRNVLIYLEPILQKKALTTFHYSLMDKGLLVLGKSETIGSNYDLFSMVNTHEKVYQRKGEIGNFMHVTSAGREQTMRNANIQPLSAAQTVINDLNKKTEQILLSKYTPPAVLVNEELEIVQFRGVTSDWLLPPQGKPSFHLLKMARVEIAFELRTLMLAAKTTHEAVRKEDIPVTVNGKQQYTTIEVMPVKEVPEPFYLILFVYAKPFGDFTHEDFAGNAADKKTGLLQQRIEQLEKELAQNRFDMRTITEDQEASNEELQSINEELLSSSEELQTLNEELETSKEEIQSSNEELLSLNHELVDRNEQLNSSRKFAEEVFATIRDAMVVLDTDFKILRATNGFYKKFEVSEKEIEGRTFYEVMDSEWQINELKDLLKKVSAEATEFSNFEVTQTFSKLGQRNLLVNARQAERIDGHKSILLAIEDVTDKRRVEEVLRELEKTNENLQRSNADLDQFASIASHDLKEPLRKISTFANMIGEHHPELDANVKNLLRKIVTSAQRMDLIMDNLLDYSKINGFEKTTGEVDLNDIMKDLISDFELQVQEKKATIVVKDLPVVPGIYLLMSQLFYNLINNALKFSKKDVAPVITISYTLLSNETLRKDHRDLNRDLTYADIVVADNGIGFDEQYSERIFQIFQRLHGRSEYEGTGIGLALCRKIALQHEGAITVSSKEGEGATFHVFLPIINK